MSLKNAALIYQAEFCNIEHDLEQVPKVRPTKNFDLSKLKTCYPVKT